MMGFWLAPFVVAQRIPHLVDEATRLSMGQPASNSRPEMERMVTEKIEAIHKGILDSSLESMRSSVAIGVAMATGNALHASQLMAEMPSRISKAAMKPANTTMRANAVRLSKRK